MNREPQICTKKESSAGGAGAGRATILFHMYICIQTTFPYSLCLSLAYINKLYPRPTGQCHAMSGCFLSILAVSNSSLLQCGQFSGTPSIYLAFIFSSAWSVVLQPSFIGDVKYIEDFWCISVGYPQQSCYDLVCSA